MTAKKTTTAKARTTAKRPARTTTRAAANRTRARTTTVSRRARTTPPSPRTGGMTVSEAGRMGGLKGGKKGGETVKAERGIKFYKKIGRMGGQRVRQLIEEGRAALERRERRASK